MMCSMVTATASWADMVVLRAVLLTFSAKALMMGLERRSERRNWIPLSAGAGIIFMWA